MTVWDTPRGRLTRIGEYDLGATLGRGAYAHVRLATHRVTGDEFACKILPALHVPGVPVTWDKTLDAMEAYKEIVLLKALAGASIPGIVQLEGMMEEEGWTYVFMRLYDGELRGDLGLKSDDKIIPFFRALLRTVEALHRLRVSHEDIKRSNVLILKSHGRLLPVLADFGFAHFVPEGGRVKSLGGTVDYSSPEKVKNDYYDPFASEVWSLGILLCKLLRIPHPYVHDDKWSSERLKKSILDGKPKWQWRKNDLRDGGIAEVIKGMLHRDPLKRWTIEDVLVHPYMYDNSEPSRSIRISHRPRLEWNVERPVSRTVLLDICFLAQQHGDFVLCQNPEIMEAAIYDQFPHWQQRWATMLTRYEKQREVKEWLDMIPPTIEERKTKSAPSRFPRRVQGLREIHLTPADVPKKLPRQIPVHNSPLSRKVLIRNHLNEENKPPRTPQMVVVGRGVGAAVGVAVPRIVGPSGFGRHRNVREVALSELRTTTPALSGAEMDSTPTKAPKPTKSKLGPPVKTFTALGPKKTVPAQTRAKRSSTAEKKIKELTINAPHLNRKGAAESRV